MSKSKKRAKVAALAAETFDWSVSDPAFAEFLRMSGITSSTLTEEAAMGLTAYYRANALISGTIAGLPLKVFRDLGDGAREQVPHFLSDNPTGPFDMSAFAFKETLVLHLLGHNEAYLKTLTNGFDEVVGVWPIHPSACNKVTWDGPDKVFEFALANGGTETFITGEVTQVLGMSTDGTRGISPLSVLRGVLNTALAGNTAANASLTSGALISGLVTTEEDVDADEAKTIKEALNAKMKGAEHAGDIAFVNRSLKFSPWKMSNVDAQFLETRGMSIEEVARIYGLPLSVLSVSGAVSNWGTGVSESFLGLQKFVLTGWTRRIESALQSILPPDHFAEFEYKGLLAGTPKEEVELLIAQVTAGLLTKDEARAILNRPPLTPEQAAASAPPAPPAPPADKEAA